MIDIKTVYLKASGLALLAFCFFSTSYAQKIISLSGANSPQDDMNPVWIGDETLLFTRAFHPDNIGGETDPGDIWMTKKSAETGEWLPAVHRGDLSTDGYDFALGLEDFLTLLVYHTGGQRFGVYQYSKFGKDWNFLRKIEVENLEMLTGKITGRVAQGGKFMFLSGEAEDSEGNEDIYVSEKVGPIKWSKPVNLGTGINTLGQEMSPFFDVDTQQLYFSSNMHEGAQGKDIFIAKKLGEDWTSWSKPGIWKQISSAGSEMSVTFISHDEVVWTSTQNSDGFADLLTFETKVPLAIPSEFTEAVAPVEQVASAPAIRQSPPSQSPEIQKIEVPAAPKESSESVVSADKNELTPISWFVVDAKNKTLVPFTLAWNQEGEKKTADAKEELFQNSLEESGVKELKVLAQGYFPSTVHVQAIRRGEPTVVLMTKAETGNVLLLENVNFKRGTSELEGEETIAALNDIAEFLVENPSIALRINGHTDNAGDPSLNKELSMERAGSVRDYLVAQGVAFEKLRVSGWGGTRPLASNTTESGRAKNRRVELEVIQ